VADQVVFLKNEEKLFAQLCECANEKRYREKPDLKGHAQIKNIQVILRNFVA
jgi:hypothetical protein